MGPTLHAQDITVAGNVYDVDADEPLSGVNILVKGTDIGTASDIDGNYITNVLSLTDTLVFSFVGYRTQEVPINGRTEIRVGLMPQAIAGEELVVVGYGEQEMKYVVGSVASVSPREVEDIPAANLTGLLQGRMAGVSAGGERGRPGSAGSSLTIRETSSFSGSAEPLFVIDGFIRDKPAFDILDPSEVENIAVLKDASAAIYGARGANGVVLVTTKQGREGRAQINYSGSYGVSEPTMLTPMLSAYDHAILLNNQLRITNPDSYASDPRYYTEDELVHFRTVDYNWLDEGWQNSAIMRHAINVSGGSERVRYFGGVSYYDETGNIEQTGINKYTLRLGIDADITDDLKASIMLSGDERKDERPNNDEDGNPDVLNATFQSFLLTPRWLPPYINGLPVGQHGTVESHALEISRMSSYNRNRGTSLTLNAALQYDIPVIEGLGIQASYSQNESNAYNKQYQVGYDLYNFETAGGNNHIITDVVQGSPVYYDNNERIFENYDHGRSYQLNGSLSFKRTLGRHNIDAMLMYEQAESEGNNFRARREGMLIPGYERHGAFDESQQETWDGASVGARLSYLGRLNYIYAEKYIMEAVFRYEGSSKFLPETRWGFFPSVALGWLISEESFFRKNVSFIDFLKLRASYGLLGNDAIAIRQWELSYDASEGEYLGGSSRTNALNTRRSGLILSGITWEKTQSLNGGLDIGLTNNFDITIDGYYRYTFEILTNRHSSVPTSVGINSSPDENFGRMDACGFDGSINYQAILSQDMSFRLGIVTSWSRSRILEMFQSPGIIGTWRDQIGRMPGDEPGYFAEGIIRTQEQLDEILAENPNYTIFGMEPEVGMIYYRDVGGPNNSDEPDGIIDENDRRVIAPAVSALGFGVNIGANWKGLRVSANVGISGIGDKVFLDKEAYTPPTATRNGPAFWADHWTPENPDAKYPRPINYGGDGERSTFWMRDALSVNLNNVSASYNLPAILTTQLGVSRVRVYFSGRNIWRIINPFDYKDPSVATYYAYPTLRTLNFGLNIDI